MNTGQRSIVCAVLVLLSLISVSHGYGLSEAAAFQSGGSPFKGFDYGKGVGAFTVFMYVIPVVLWGTALFLWAGRSHAQQGPPRASL